jgi:hypothetical protein
MAVSMPTSFSAEDARTDVLAAFRRRERARREAHAPKATGARLAIARPEMFMKTRALHVVGSEGVVIPSAADPGRPGGRKVSLLLSNEPFRSNNRRAAF